ncbi:MAG: nitroreductase family protein [Sphingobacteriales bacterium]|nr:MAG: nitroreductase family protein [Sphingobacteriales bacterium]
MKKGIINKIKFRINRHIDKKLPLTWSHSKFLSAFYYFALSRSFYREFQAALSGKAKYITDDKEKGNYFLLVRNTHRIEKGLLMKPRRATFATEYITETVDAFEKVVKNAAAEDNQQLKWFNDVLTEYFDKNEPHKIVDQQRVRFAKCSGELNGSVNTDCKFIPYHRRVDSFAKIDFEEFYKFAKQRRSVRWFLDKKVPRELIDKAVLAANQSPSACNRQPFEYRIIDDPELVKKAVHLPMGTGGYAHSIPVMVVVVGNLDAYFSERDRHVIYVDASLANMAFMFALETLGLSSCSINWPDIEDREIAMEKFLKLGKHQRPIMCMGIGYPDPDGMVAYSEKRPLDQIRKYNFE